MAAVFWRERSASDSFLFQFRFAPDYLAKPSTVTRTERQVAAGFLAMAGVVLATQWNEIKQELFRSGVSDAVVQAVNEDTRHIRILKDHVEYVERMATKMTTSLAYTERYEQLEDQYDRLVGLKNECFDQYSYQYAGIDQLLNSPKPNNTLVPTPLCPESLDSVESEGLQRASRSAHCGLQGSLSAGYFLRPSPQLHPGLVYPHPRGGPCQHHAPPRVCPFPHLLVDPSPTIFGGTL